MNTANIILAGTTGIIIGLTLAIAFLMVRSSRVKPRVLAVLKDGATIRGALLARRASYVVLGGAELLEQGKATPIDGLTYIDRANIQWLQEPNT